MNDALTGRKIGQYELHEVIGRGGMAIIYRASQPRMDRDVAVKIVAGPHAHTPAFIHRFEDEARAYARLQHPHILPVYDVGLEGDRLYLVMAYMPGGTLSRRIAAMPGGLPLEEIACITVQVASALDHAHAQGIIHCDLKPGNILLDGRGNAYLGDFGIAQLAVKDAPPSQGTFAYMAPELIDGVPAAPASDIFSLGVVVFEMLAGSRPFEVHTGKALREVYSQLVTPDVRQRRPDLPAGVQVVLEQALNRDPAARPRQATSLAQALMRACGLVGLPCADIGSESLTVERESMLGPGLDSEDSGDLRTPLPFAGLENWPWAAREVEPNAASDGLERDGAPTAVALPTRMFPPAASSERRRRHILTERLLLLILLVMLCLLLESAALIVLVMPVLQR
ncbi:MAG: serine/threonine protein kinase [Anaerolineae bacterium]|nr:serine/threonine protein kinase [Anaerolineae bacterium]